MKRTYTILALLVVAMASNPGLYKTMRDFMPRYIEAVNNYEVKIP